MMRLHRFITAPIMFLFFTVCVVAQQTPPTAQPQSVQPQDIELNTVLMESTFKIEGRTTQGTTLGTAFIMGRPYANNNNKARYVLITAAHVLDEMQGDTATLHLRRKVDQDTWQQFSYQIPIRSNGQPLWKKHPGADVAVMYVRMPAAVSIPLLPTNLLADDNALSQFDIHPGDELECLGYPFGSESNEAGFPILRSGKIASYPLLPTAKTKTFLFDFRIFQGNSGGPVYFVQSIRTINGITRMQSIHFIIGLVSQEMIFPEQISTPYSQEIRQFQLGIAIVIHASLIREALELLPSPETLQD